MSSLWSYPWKFQLHFWAVLPMWSYEHWLWDSSAVTTYRFCFSMYPFPVFQILQSSTQSLIWPFLCSQIHQPEFGRLCLLCWPNYLSVKFQENTDKYLIIYFLGKKNNKSKTKRPPRFVTSVSFDSVNIPSVASFNLLWSHWVGNWEGTAPLIPASPTLVTPLGEMSADHFLAHFSVLFPQT